MTQPALLTRPFVLLTTGHLLQALGYSSLLLLPLYLGHLGANRTLIGSIMAFASLTSLAFRPAVAWSLDVWGRKPTLYVGTSLMAVGMWLLFWVTDLGYLVYVSRFLVGVGLGALFTGYLAFAGDIIPLERRTEGLALFGISGLVPLMINPFSSQLGIAPVDLRWFLPLVGIVIALSMVSLIPIEEPQTSAKRKSLKWRDVLRTLSHRSLRPVWLAAIVLSGLVATFMTFVTVSAKDRGIPGATYVWLTYAGAAVLVRVFGSRLADRIGPANLIVPGLSCYAISLVWVAGATSFQELLWAGSLAGIGHGYCFPVVSGQVIARASEAHRGSALSMFTALWSLTEISITPILGAFADQFGDASMFALTATSSAVLLVYWAFLEHKNGGGPSGEVVEHPKTG